MNRQQTIEFLEKEIEMYKKLIEQEERLIKTIPNRSDVILEDNKDTLKELIKELKELKEQQLLLFFFFIEIRNQKAKIKEKPILKASLISD